MQTRCALRNSKWRLDFDLVRYCSQGELEPSRCDAAPTAQPADSISRAVRGSAEAGNNRSHCSLRPSIVSCPALQMSSCLLTRPRPCSRTDPPCTHEDRGGAGLMRTRSFRSHCTGLFSRQASCRRLLQTKSQLPRLRVGLRCKRTKWAFCAEAITQSAKGVAERFGAGRQQWQHCQRPGLYLVSRDATRRTL